MLFGALSLWERDRVRVLPKAEPPHPNPSPGGRGAEAVLFGALSPWERDRVRVLRRFSNDRQHCIRLTQNLIVPEPQNPETVALQPGVPPGICCPTLVLTAIGLYHQASLELHEIHHIRPERMLPSELVAVEPP